MNKNADKLASFTAYCVANPEQRFWQALRNWAKVESILLHKQTSEANSICNIETALGLLGVKDTFYLE